MIIESDVHFKFLQRWIQKFQRVGEGGVLEILERETNGFNLGVNVVFVTKPLSMWSLLRFYKYILNIMGNK